MNIRKHLHWGNAIVLVFAIFIGTVVFRIYLSVQNFPELVTPDYYELELAHQEVIDKTDNARRLGGTFEVSADDEQVRVRFPNTLMGEKPEGTIVFYRASDSSLDRSYPMDISPEAEQRFPIADFRKGTYKVKAEWTLAGRAYLLEKEFTVWKENPIR